MPKVVKEMFNTTIAQQLEQLIADMQRKVEIKGESKPTPKSFLTENVQHADSSIDLDAGEEDEVTPTPKSQHTCQVSRGYMDGIDLRPTGLKQAVHSRNEPPVTVKGESSVNLSRHLQLNLPQRVQKSLFEWFGMKQPQTILCCNPYSPNYVEKWLNQHSMGTLRIGHNL